MQCVGGDGDDSIRPTMTIPLHVLFFGSYSTVRYRTMQERQYCTVVATVGTFGLPRENQRMRLR